MNGAVEAATGLAASTTTPMPRFADVAVPVPSLSSLTYTIPPQLTVQRGARVLVPLGSRLTTGVVLTVSEGESPAPGRVRAIERVLDPEPFLPPAVVALALWVADYYMCSPGEAIAAAMPPMAWIESERRWELTELGSELRANTSGKARRVVDFLAEGAAQTTSALVSVLMSRGRVAQPEAIRASVDGLLRRLARSGMVRPVTQLVGRADASKIERVIRPPGGTPDEALLATLTVRQREALTAIRQLAACEDGVVSFMTAAEQGITPPVVRALAKRGLLSLESRRVDRTSGEGRGEALVGSMDDAEVQLTGEQQAAVDTLVTTAGERTFRVALLHGVTGSGKTEIYRRLARHVCAQGRQVLVLVPEIALTPTVAARLHALFAGRLAIQHSALSDGERYDQWQRIRNGDVDVVVGTRSAVFSPLERLGLVIVDEEHDTSYKQEEAPRYHGRDAAIIRARDANALVVLGSATPSMESYRHALSGRYRLIELTRRVLDRPLADVSVVNMRDEFAEAGPDTVLSAALKTAIGARLDEHEQTIVLLNRRGYAANVFCRQCGDTLECPNCSVSLTVHRGARRARCHYCDYARVLPEHCLKCGATYLEYQGVGTERVEADVRAAFPRARVARVDRDTMRRRGEIVRVLRAFGRREIDVLVGTQMIAKGHDFPAVTLVGVVSADVGLGVADFRAAERTFQLLTQVAGRAGRGERRGQAIIQTLFPEHYSIELAQRQDYGRFYQFEAEFREHMHHPPAMSLISVVVRHAVEAKAREQAMRLSALVARRSGVTVLGPAPAPLVRLRGQFRYQFFLRGQNRPLMRQTLRDALAREAAIARAATVDVDPLSVL